MIIIVTSGPRSLLNVAFSCLLIKGACGRGSRWHRFSLIVMKRGRYFLPLVTFPYDRREDIYLEWTHHSASPRFPSFILSAVPHPPFAFASSLSVRFLERVYFRLVSKVNTVAYGLALVHLLLTTLTKVARHGKRSGRTRAKAEPANRNVRLQAASVRQLGDDLSSCPFGS